MTWVIVETYYKHAEYNLFIMENDALLTEHLIEKLEEYDNRRDDYSNLDLDDLIELAEYIGNERVSSQMGWGIREIRKIN